MIEPVVKEVWVKVSPGRAFQGFTDDLARWWPLKTHSLSEAACVDARFEDGRLVEEARDGTVHEWARVQAWEPPTRLVLLWYPGRAPEVGGDVEVTFTAEGDGTRVRVVHTGWERLGAEGPELRANYDTGWAPVLAAYQTSLG